MATNPYAYDPSTWSATYSFEPWAPQTVPGLGPPVSPNFYGGGGPQQGPATYVAPNGELPGQGAVQPTQNFFGGGGPQQQPPFGYTAPNKELPGQGAVQPGFFGGGGPQQAPSPYTAPNGELPWQGAVQPGPPASFPPGLPTQPPAAWTPIDNGHAYINPTGQSIGARAYDAMMAGQTPAGSPAGTTMNDVGQWQTPDGWKYQGGSWIAPAGTPSGNGPSWLGNTPAGMGMPGVGSGYQDAQGNWLNDNGQPGPFRGGGPGGGGGGMGGGMGNPYLSAQASAITDQFGRQFTNYIAPQIRSQAQAAGGFGGSRQGVAEGLAAQGLQQQLGSALAGLYGNAYESDMNRGLQRYGIDIGAGTTMRGQDITRELGLGNLGLGANRLGLDAALGFGGLGLQGQRLGLDTALGMGGLGIQQQQADTARLGTMGNLALGAGNLNLGQSRLGLDAELGRGNLGLGYYGADTARMLGLGNLGVAQQNAATNLLGTNNAYSLGLGNLALGNLQANNNYNLGLGNLALGNRNTDLNQQRLGSDLWTQALTNGINANNALWTQGQRDLYAGLGPANAYAQFLNPWASLTGSGVVGNPGTGGGLGGALGGGIAGLQLLRLLGLGG